MTWKQDKLNGEKLVNRYGWSLEKDDYGFLHFPVAEALEWFKWYRSAVEHCDDGSVGLLVGSTKSGSTKAADRIIDQWIQQEADDERERLEALAVLDALAGSR